MLLNNDNFLSCAHPQAVCVLFHGYGSNGQNLWSMAQTMQRLLKDRVAFWIPNGSEICQSYALGWQWFSLENIALTDPLSLHVLEDRLQKACEKWKQAARPLLDSLNLPLFLGGFSQGAAFAYHLGLYGLLTQGILGFSGFYHMKEKPLFSPPLLWCHGDQDTVVSIDNMHQNIPLFKKHDLALESHVLYGQGHTITEKAIRHGANFMEPLLSA